MSKSNLKPSAILSSLLVATLLTASSKPALAQSSADTYPSKVVTLVNPFVAGSTTDGDARPLLQYLTAALGKSFVVDYRPGAGGILGNNYVAKAKPDGYTLLIVSTSFTTNFALRDNVPYSYKDFAPVSLLSRRPVILVVTPSLPVKSFAEYLAYARANPDKLNWGTSGAGSIFHMAGAYLAAATGTKITFVHYKGNAQGFVDLVAGRTQVSPMTTFAALPYIKAGQVRPIAHLTASRSRAMPNLPSVAELGVVGYDYSGWGGHTHHRRLTGNRGQQARYSDCRLYPPARCCGTGRPRRLRVGEQYPRGTGQDHRERSRAMGKSGSGKQYQGRRRIGKIDQLLVAGSRLSITTVTSVVFKPLRTDGLPDEDLRFHQGSRFAIAPF